MILEDLKPGFNAAHGYVLPEDPDNASIRWGTAFEDAIWWLAQEKAGQPIGYRERAYTHPEYDYLTCHIDGRYEDGVLHEGKTAGYFAFLDSWGEPGTDRIPTAYQLQVQHQMLCTGASAAVVSVLVFPRRPEEWEQAGLELAQAKGQSGDPQWFIKTPGWTLSGEYQDHPETNQRVFGTIPGRYVPCSSWARTLDEMGYFHQYTVDARSTLQAELLSRYREWWETYVVGEREPEPRSADDVRRLFPTPKGTVVADEQTMRWATEYREIGEEISGTGRLGKRREELRVLILQYMRRADSQVDDESREKTVLRDNTGKKLAQWNGKVFRT